MKKFTFLLVMILAFAGFTMAQTIEDFEIQKMNLFDDGANGALSVIPNPDPTGIDTSAMVCKMIRGKDGLRSAGWYGALPAVDITNNKYVHLKIWKPRKSPVVFKFEKGTGPDTGDIYPMGSPADSSNATINAWEELVFDYSNFSGSYSQIVLIPDFVSVPSLGTQLTEDIIIYFDDIYVNNDPTVGSKPVRMLENYEHIPLHAYSEQGTFTLINNPDPSGLNLSSWVMDFLRPATAPDWAGFYSELAKFGFDSVDVTTNKYVHVKAWKPVISVVKFKLQDGPDGNLEIPSTNAQVKVNDWEDYVFDFSGKTGKYAIIGLSLDVPPPAFSGDIHIYFDDIIVNNDPNPMEPAVQKISIDMSSSPLVAGDHMYITGSFGGIYGTWAEPGTNPNNEMFDTDGNGIYSIDMHLGDGSYTLKFAKNNWGGQDPLNQDRPLTFTGSINVLFTWQAAGYIDATVSVRENKLAGKIQMYPNPVRDNLSISTTSDIRKVVITNTLGKVIGNYTYTNNQSINTRNLSNGMYFVTFIGRDGSKVTQKLIKD